jgi:superfamily II DNA/RNA helicase
LSSVEFFVLDEADRMLDMGLRMQRIGGESPRDQVALESTTRNWRDIRELLAALANDLRLATPPNRSLSACRQPSCP